MWTHQTSLLIAPKSCWRHRPSFFNALKIILFSMSIIINLMRAVVKWIVYVLYMCVARRLRNFHYGAFIFNAHQSIRVIMSEKTKGKNRERKRTESKKCAKKKKTAILLSPWDWRDGNDGEKGQTNEWIKINRAKQLAYLHVIFYGRQYLNRIQRIVCTNECGNLLLKVNRNVNLLKLSNIYSLQRIYISPILWHCIVRLLFRPIKFCCPRALDKASDILQI